MEPDVFGHYENVEEPAARTRGWLFRAFVLIVVLFVGILYASRAPSSFPESGGIFTIEPGASLKSVSSGLLATNYIRSRTVFSTAVTFFGGEHRISPGDYAFSSRESTIGIARQIATGAHRLEPIKITIPEGDTVRDIAEVLSKKIPDFNSVAFLAAAKNDEGYLFPETYFLYPKTSVQDIRNEMRAMFDEKTNVVLGASMLGLEKRADIVTMASLVEREAHGDDDRAIIAGILWKRLEMHMALQVDATVAYATGVADADLSKADFASDSLYNTYKYRGLPPGPIANPGLKAIEAAIHPAKTDYLYYLHDAHGTIHYAKTYAEHQKNIAKYLK